MNSESKTFLVLLGLAAILFIFIIFGNQNFNQKLNRPESKENFQKENNQKENNEEENIFLIPVEEIEEFPDRFETVDHIRKAYRTNTIDELNDKLARGILESWEWWRWVVKPENFDSCFYLEIKICERLTKNGVEISFIKAFPKCELVCFWRPLSGVQPWDRWDYIVEVYNSRKELKEKYVISSARFCFYDFETEEGKIEGGVIEAKESQTSFYIPYDRDDPPVYLRIVAKDKKTDFAKIPLEKTREQFRRMEVYIREGNRFRAYYDSGQEEKDMEYGIKQRIIEEDNSWPPGLGMG